ncbi:NfeD family protein [Petrocella sp. FN5]|uniref:NfeD family protein n=1 Tax=Petrocella sp. FN5 TaxID=3032002 RepID=UPI0023DBC8B4|nr:NfeD family protein [Petrocella sp. FN5]MDF1618820.1 NfeD family protein [Petrocella sp. FN5]
METLPILLIAIGILLLIAEIFIPSFGITGGIGIVAILIGVIMTTNTVAEGVVMFLVILLVAIILMYLAYKFIASKRSPLIQKAQLNEEILKSDLNELVGKTGVALTSLRPSGKGAFVGLELDVLTKGSFITKGSKIIISEMEGKKIFVKSIE